MGIYTLLIDIVLCLAKDQFMLGIETIKTVVALNGLFEKKINIIHFLWKLISSVQFSHSVMSDSLWPHESQHARPPCPSQTLGVYSNSCSSSILDTYRPGDFFFQYPIILPSHTVHGVLKARILKWFAIPFSSES